MNTSVEQALPAHEVNAIFRDADAACEALLADAINGDRGRRQQQSAYAPTDGDMDGILRVAIAQI
jgi:hypothetical protein